MNIYLKWSTVFLRIVMGWMFFWAGITKVLDPAWSAEGYLKGAKMLTGFYGWLASPGILPFNNFVNEWGLTLLGLSLILGLAVRWTVPFGVVLMLLYYIPLGIIRPNGHSLLIDEHIIYIGGLLVLAALKAGTIWGLDARLQRR